MKFSLPMYWFPSPLVVMKEYILLERTKCPKCGGRLERFLQEARGPKEGWPYPVSGDLLYCRCEECGGEVVMEFEFRKPEEKDDPFEDFTEAFEFCSRSFGPQAFAGRAHMLMMDLLEHRPELADKVMEFLAERIVEKAYTGTKEELVPLVLLALKLNEEDFARLRDSLPPALSKLLERLKFSSSPAGP